MIRRVLAVLILCAGPALAQADATETARRAVDALGAAADRLAAAGGARDRVKALTETVRAYEDGLSAVRAGIREAALRERVLETELAGQEAGLANLLGVLLTLETSTETAALLHPSGPADTARAAMIVADVSPAIAERVGKTRAKLDELRLLRELQDAAAAQLQTGLSGVRDARTALSLAISERTATSGESATDIATMQALINSADTLQGFAASLALPPDDDAPTEGIVARRGNLALPVRGTLLIRYGETDAAGRTRPGIVLATEPGAIVTAPVSATLRYAGPLLDQGQVSILEPESGVLLILAGLGRAYGSPGDVLAEGDALGLMGGSTPSADQILIETREGSGQFRQETLYIEFRQDDTPLNPEEWFAATAG